MLCSCNLFVFLFVVPPETWGGRWGRGLFLEEVLLLLDRGTSAWALFTRQRKKMHKMKQHPTISVAVGCCWGVEGVELDERLAAEGAGCPLIPWFCDRWCSSSFNSKHQRCPSRPGSPWKTQISLFLSFSFSHCQPDVVCMTTLSYDARRSFLSFFLFVKHHTPNSFHSWHVSFGHSWSAPLMREGETERGRERFCQRLGTQLSDWPQRRSGSGFLPGIGPAAVIKAMSQEQSQLGRHAVVLLPAEKNVPLSRSSGRPKQTK